MNATIHSIVCNTPTDEIYKIIANSAVWADIYEPCRNVELLKKSNNREVIRITADVNGVEMHWESKRTFLEDIYGIDFEIVTPFPPLKSMGGHWRIVPLEPNKSLLFLEHHFQVEEDVSDLIEGVNTSEEAIDFTMQGIDRNSHKELNSIKTLAEQNCYQPTKL